MTKTTKIVLITSGILLISATAVFAFRKKKPVASAIKRVGSIVWPEGLSDSEAVNEDGSSSVKLGSTGRYVSQLQDTLNEIHQAVNFINTQCATIKWGYATGTLPGGGIVTPSGTFDAATAKASQFYLNRQEVEIEYLNEIREKVARWKQGDKCIYPLSV